MSLLLASVFRPFGVDDEYGRKENKLELFNNQVTREQGVFSLRYNHRSFGLYFIAENIKMPTVILDFPTLKQFRKEVRKGYDYVGISFITPNFVKAKKMVEIVRQESPSTKIILGGHGTMIPDIENLVDVDHIIRGEGIYSLRELFGEDVDAPIKHPVLPSADHKRILGLPIAHTSAVLIPGVGCPNACRFCATSHFFDKTYTPYLKTGKDIYDTLVMLSEKLGTDDFFVMDENFLKHKERAVELLELMEKNNRTFGFSVFSSAEAITEFGIENMVRLGVMYVWIGAESRHLLFEKNKDVNLPELIAEMRRNGIYVLASSILFLEHQTRENIQEDIDYAIDLKPDFTQFMQLGPLPQTKLYQDYKDAGKLREDIPYEEWHGQHRIWFDHDNFTAEETETILRDAFKKEFDVLGPSILRIGETMIDGLDSPTYQIDSELMKRRYELLRKKCKDYYYALTAISMLSPTKNIRQISKRVLGKFSQKIGRRTPLHMIASLPIYVAARITQVKLNLGYEAHNPKQLKTMFRVAPQSYKMMRGRIESIMRSRKAWAFLENRGGAFELSLHFSGKIKEKTMISLMKRLSKRSDFSLSAIKINVAPMADFNEETFEKFMEKLSKRSQDIRIYCSETHRKNIRFFERMASKRMCSVSTY